MARPRLAVQLLCWFLRTGISFRQALILNGAIMFRTWEQVREEFKLRGISAADWARRNGFSSEVVYQVLRAQNVPNRGQSHRIAVARGMKAGHEEHDYNLKLNQIPSQEE